MKIKKLAAMGVAAAICVASIASCFTLQVRAEEDYWPSSIEVDSNSAVVLEQETGTILYSKNMDEELYPASITKIMTALVVLENCDNLDDIVTFSSDAVYKNEGDTSHIARDIGEEMTVEWTLYGMMLESANECAWALGEYIAGDIDSFIEMMNDKAAELGCTHTHFNNPNGLPDKEHYTSAHDMALISRAAFAIPKFREIVGTKAYMIPPTNKHSAETPLHNHHDMLHYHSTGKYVYQYCLGGKTGYTVDSGNTLVTYAKKDGMTLVCVVMKTKSPSHYLDTTNLFEYCFNNFTTYRISDFESIEDSTETSSAGKLSEYIDLIKIDEDGVIVLPRTASFADARSKVTSFKDPDNKNVIGKIAYTYAGKDVGDAKLIFATNEGQSYSFDNVAVENGGSGKEYIKIDFMQFVLVFVIVAAVVALVLLIKSKSSDILLFRYRHFKSRRKEKSNLTVINRTRSRKRHKRR